MLFFKFFVVKVCNYHKYKIFSLEVQSKSPFLKNINKSSYIVKCCVPLIIKSKTSYNNRPPSCLPSHPHCVIIVKIYYDPFFTSLVCFMATIQGDNCSQARELPGNSGGKKFSIPSGCRQSIADGVTS